jgi:hypothetical protein
VLMRLLAGNVAVKMCVQYLQSVDVQFVAPLSTGTLHITSYKGCIQ